MIMAWYIMVCWKHGWMEGEIDGPDLCEGCDGDGDGDGDEDGDGWMDEGTDECMHRLLITQYTIINHLPVCSVKYAVMSQVF